jgi:phosphoribosylformylglycinamidine cyclo-ligase
VITPQEGLSYADAGVDIGAYNRVFDRLKALVDQTHGPAVSKGIGGFAGLYELLGGTGHLAASADGVGTKIKIATAAHRHRGIGVDLVNHCVNDIATMGARPLFLLDYFACGHLDESVLLDVVAGMSDACLAAGCALLGGETAEMPGVYALGDYDLAGFIVGLVDRGRLPNPARIKAGDVLLAFPSSGLHTNGFSLVRRVFEDVDLEHVYPQLGRPLWQELLEPHRSYANELRHLWPQWKVAAHITGGGLIGNVPRVLPEGLAARFDLTAWQVPPVFRLIQHLGRVDSEEMFGTFNMGLGMVVVAARDDAARLTGTELIAVGEVVEQRSSARVVLD